MSSFLHVSMSHVYVSMVSEFHKRKTELTENGNFRLFAANGKQKWPTFVCLLHRETENGSVFSIVDKG